MKKKRVLALLVSAVVFVTMSFGMTCTAFAGEKTGLAATQEKIGDISDMANVSQPIELIADEQEATLNDDVVVPGQDAKALFGSSFKISAPSTGYIMLYLVGKDYYDTSYDWSIYAKTKGYSDYVSFSSYYQFVRYFAVKQGTYTVYVDNKYGDYYLAAAKYVKVKESKYGTKKSRAPKIKKKKIQKGLMITGAQKAHWYKIKNTKKHKAKIYITTMLEETGNYSGGIKVTFYKGKKSFGSKIIYNNSNEIVKTTLTPYNTLGMKLAKGTYYIKVAPYKKGTGYFKLKWR